MITIHDDTKASLIEDLSSMVGAVFKDRLIHRNRMDRLEAEKEKELELARIRNEIGGSDEAIQETVDDVEQTPDPTPAEIEAAIDDLIDEEMCAVCQELLRGLKQRTPREQVRGVMEYGTFKKELDDEAGVEELKNYIAQTEVLHAVLEENLSPAG